MSTNYEQLGGRLFVLALVLRCFCQLSKNLETKLFVSKFLMNMLKKESKRFLECDDCDLLVQQVPLLRLSVSSSSYDALEFLLWQKVLWYWNLSYLNFWNFLKVLILSWLKKEYFRILLCVVFALVQAQISFSLPFQVISPVQFL